MEIKCLITEWVGQRKNTARMKKIPGTKQKWKHSITAHLWQMKAVLEGKFVALSAYIRKWERAQMSDLKIWNLKMWKNKNKQNPNPNDS